MTTEPAQLLEQLDPEQRQVASQTEGPMCVLAGAGTGKTRAITYRIAYGLQTGAYAPGSVLALTFTNRAASEMRTRLAQLGARGAVARTFHSAALKQLSYFWPTACGGDFPQILKHKAPVLSAVVARMGLASSRESMRDLAAEIEWSKVNQVGPSEYAKVAQSLRRQPPLDLSYQAMADAFALYEDVRWEANMIDFEDVLLLMLGIMTERPDVAREVRSQYQHFVVDEYQDVSPLQHSLLMQWLGHRPSLCVVGDVAQTIYSFTGAQSRYLAEFTQDHPGAKRVVLDRDYRSTPQIVSIANRVLEKAPDHHLAGSVTLRSQLPAGPAVQFDAYADDEAEAAAIAQRINSQIKSGIPASDIAVLFRTNSQSAAFESALAHAGVSYLVRGGTEFYSRPEVRQTITRFNAMIAAVGSDSITDIMRQSASQSGWTAEAPKSVGAMRDRWEVLNALVELVEDLEGRNLNPKQIRAELTERARSDHAPTVQGVTLATLHSAKGLEWQCVYLVGASEKLLPISLATTPDAIEEERRLLYVGITRAKRELSISYAQSRSEGRSKRKRSRFLDGIWPSDGTEGQSASRSDSRTRSAKAAAQFQQEASSAAIERFEALRQWRLEKSKATARPAYTIFTDLTLREIALANPYTIQELGRLRGIGDAKLTEWGEDLLQLLRSLD